MSAHTHIPVPGKSAPVPVKSALSRWFGIRPASPQSEEEAVAAPSPARLRLSLEEEAQRDLLTQITTFLLENRLTVTPGNLLAAHAAFSGTNPRLARKIALKRGEERAAPVVEVPAPLRFDAEGRPEPEG